MSRLRALAALAPAPVFVAPGTAGRRVVRRLLASPDIDIVRSPRHATVLVVAGGVPRGFETALAHVHDQLPHPRAVVHVVTHAPAGPGFTDPVELGPADDLVAAVTTAHREVVGGDRASSRRLLSDEHPVDWKGTGDHGQGGEGMMSGVPYGRPMAMTGDDLRDGLQLDRVPVTIGPFVGAWWPPGLVLDLEVQGDLVVTARVAAVRRFPDEVHEDDRPDVVLDVLLALGHVSLGRRWVRGDRARLRRDVRVALRGIGRGVGCSPVDGTDVRDRVWRTLDGDPDPAPVAEAVAILPDVLPGLAWRDAAVALASLGLDLTRPGHLVAASPTDGPSRGRGGGR